MINESESHSEQPEVVVVTGMSGAGKNTVLHALEDSGFFCIDNLPLSFVQLFFASLDHLAVEGEDTPHRRMALGVDIRSGSALEEVAKCIGQARERGCSVKVIYVTASLATLAKRFQETRRKHPLGDMLDVHDALARERTLLEPLERCADQVVDTDQLTIHQLRSLVRNLLGEQGRAPLIVSLTSFGFKYGVPAEQNFVFDLRSLPNPFFIPELKPLDGTDTRVQQFLFEQPEVLEYWEKLIDFFSFALKAADKEGRSSVHIAIGCTGGRHRSVAFVQRLALVPLEQVHFFIKHRDLVKDLG